MSASKSGQSIVTISYTQAAAPIWKQPWRGPVLANVSTVAPSHQGDFIAFGYSRSSVVELWDVSSFPCRMTQLELPKLSNESYVLECIHTQWSHQNSTLCCVYMIKTASKKIFQETAFPEISYTVLWDLHTAQIKHSYWYGHTHTLLPTTIVHIHSCI
jgi:hypothetical protein